MALPSLPVSHFPRVVGKILWGGNRAARFALGVTAVGLLTSPLDKVLSRIERRRRKAAGDPTVIFVVGLPRSGSTFVAERLRQSLNVVALNSAMAVWPRSRFLIHRWLRRFEAKGDYCSYYGHGSSWFSSGDTYSIWDQWLGRSHNLPPKLTDSARRDMVDYFRELSAVYGKPVLAKNNRNALLVEELSRLFPKGLFVVVEREFSEVVRSTIRATREFGLRDRVWGLSSTDEPEAIVGNKVEEACRRSVERLRNAMERQLSGVAENRLVRISYEDFCVDPGPFIAEIAKRAGP